MNLEELAVRVPSCGVFRTGQILSGESSPGNITRQLDRWVKSGRILQLRRGVYVLAEPYAKTRVHPFTAANALKKASYVSLHSALAHYGMIPEYVPMTTSVTTRRPEELDTPLGRFQFRHVSPRLFYGFAETGISRDQQVLLASPQKALVDLLYLTPHSDRVEYLRELRLERPERLDIDKLHATVEQCGSAKVARAVRRLIGLWKKEA